MRLILTILLSVSLSYAFGQSLSLQGIETARKSMLQPVMSNNQHTGYHIFYRGRQLDKNTYIYNIDFLDLNLKVTDSLRYRRPRREFDLLRSADNDSAYCFYFYYGDSKNLELITYDKKLKKIASKMEKLKPHDQQEFNLESYRSNTFGGMNLYAVPEKGFLVNRLAGLKKVPQLHMIDNRLNRKWTYQQADTSIFSYEEIDVQKIEKERIITVAYRMNKQGSRKRSAHLFVLDAATGKPVLDVPLEKTEDEHLSVIDLRIEDNTNQLFVFGHYHSKARFSTDDQQGYYIKKFNRAGEETYFKRLSMKYDILPKFPAEALERRKNNPFSVQSEVEHDLVIHPDGKMTLITEQYLATSAPAPRSGPANNADYSGAGNSQTTTLLGDMYVYFLNSDFTVSGIKFIPKEKARNTFSGSSASVEETLEQSDFANYKFCSYNPDGSLNFIYVNEVKTSKGETRLIGHVTLINNQEMVVKKTAEPIKGNNVYYYPYPNGRILILDHAEKAQKLTLRTAEFKK